MTAGPEVRPAFYALPRGGWRDYVTLLHPPYTLWHLSYVVLGTAAAPAVDVPRLAGALSAFFLAVGIGAHALDELHGRPLGTRVPEPALRLLAALSLLGALALGVAGTFVVSPWGWGFVAFGVFIVPAYNLEWFGGRFHSDAWFGLSWGAFPFLTGYWASAEELTVGPALLAVACFGLSLAQRRLSNRVRALRRRAAGVHGRIEYGAGDAEEVTVASLLAAPEAALRLLSASMVVLASGWLAIRL